LTVQPVDLPRRLEGPANLPVRRQQPPQQPPPQRHQQRHDRHQHHHFDQGEAAAMMTADVPSLSVQSVG
jgi:hypothetical protein